MRRSLAWLAAVLTVAATAGPAAAQDEGDGVPTTRISLRATPDEERPFPFVIDELAPATVLIMQVSGFEPNATAQVAQCVDGLRCHNTLSVRLDVAGHARFHYLVTDDFDHRGRCRLGDPPCTVVVRAGDDEAVANTVFVDTAPPPGRLDVTPAEVRVGEQITVTAGNLPPGADLTLTICAAPSTSGTRCGPPGPVAAMTIDDDGTAVATLTVGAVVGSDRVACGRRIECLVVARSDDVTVRAAPVPLVFASPPGADYDPTRLAGGVVVAALLLAMAAWLVRSTDWRPPGEADGSLIDDAEFADLDLEAAEFDEIRVRQVGSSAMP